MSDRTIMKMKMSPTATAKLWVKSCQQEEEIARLQAELTAARDEAERLRGRVSELEEDRFKLPYDVVINGGMTFKEGVGINTLVKSAERWHRQAMDQYKTLDAKRLRTQADELEAGGGDEHREKQGGL